MCAEQQSPEVTTCSSSAPKPHLVVWYNTRCPVSNGGIDWRRNKRELRRRSAIEPVIGHMKTDGHLGRCHLKGREGDAANVILTPLAIISVASSPG